MLALRCESLMCRDFFPLPTAMAESLRKGDGSEMAREILTSRSTRWQPRVFGLMMRFT